MNALARWLVSAPAALLRRWWSWFAVAALAVPVLLALTWLAGVAGYRTWHPRSPTRTAAIAAIPTRDRIGLAWGDRFGDGTPDILRLNDPVDRAAFRRWFTLIAEYQALRPMADVPAEITDCASLLRYAYREALKRHDASWFYTTGMEVEAHPGEIHAWNYPHSPLGDALFRVRPGPLAPEDLPMDRLRNLPTPKRWSSATLSSSAATWAQRCRETCSFTASSANLHPGIP